MTKGILMASTILVGLLLAVQITVFAQSPTTTQSTVSPTQSTVSPSPAVRVPSGAPATGRGL